MKRFLGLAAAITLVSTINLKAQDSKTWAIKASVNPGVTASGGSNFVLGGGVGVEKRLSNQWTATLNTGYTHYFSYHTMGQIVTPASIFVGEIEKDLELIPIKAGLNYFFDKQLYLGFDAGIGIETNGNSSFVYAPAIGMAMKNGLDLSLKYEEFSNYSRSGQVALRVAYRFSL